MSYSFFLECTWHCLVFALVFHTASLSAALCLLLPKENIQNLTIGNNLPSFTNPIKYSQTIVIYNDSILCIPATFLISSLLLEANTVDFLSNF